MTHKVKLSNNKKKKIREMVDQANQAFASGRHDVSDRLCRKIESLQPGHPDVANMRAVMCSYQGRADQAEQLFMDAIRAAPKRSAFQANLGGFYLTQRRFVEAMACYKQAISLAPDALSPRIGYCTALLETGCYEDAYLALKKVVTHQSRDPGLVMAFFTACHRSNRIEEGRQCLERVLEQDPGHIQARFELGMLEIETGHLDRGKAELRRVLEIKPDHVASCSALSKIRQYDDAGDADIGKVSRLYEQSAPDSRERMILGFALGKMMDDLGDCDRAFEYFREANDIRHRHSDYDNDRELAHLQGAMDAYTPEVLSRTSGLDDATPIFIVGMPRCGSTLVEQIMASHPGVASRGEWCFFESRLLLDHHSKEDPLTLEKIVSLKLEQWREFGQTYLDHLKADSSGATRITDKSLRNVRLIGAIHCALPKARIVHVRRHPLDTCLSIYKTNLQDQLFDYGCNLGQLGYYYRMYLRLMQHWRDVLPRGVMYELDYEGLVANQEGETRKLLDACDLEWDDHCLQFNKMDNLVRTASVAQVRRSIYTDSVSGWKRYEKHLQPLIRILGTEYGHPDSESFDEAFE